jgi:basic amino acid/polyamine antiporter, APA family
MPLVPIAPILFVIVSLLIVVNQILSNWQDAAIGLAIVATGIPAYYLWRK